MSRTAGMGEPGLAVGCPGMPIVGELGALMLPPGLTYLLSRLLRGMGEGERARLPNCCLCDWLRMAFDMEPSESSVSSITPPAAALRRCAIFSGVTKGLPKSSAISTRVHIHTCWDITATHRIGACAPAARRPR